MGRAYALDMIEEWRPIVGYEDLYEISDQGRVRSWTRRGQGMLLKAPPNRFGYRIVVLKRKTMTVHRLVMETFVGPRPPGLMTRHLNDDKLDNRLVNLSYGTRLENAEDAVRNGKHAYAGPPMENKAKTECKRNHEFTPENTYTRANGSRECRECRRDASAAWRKNAAEKP